MYPVGQWLVDRAPNFLWVVKGLGALRAREMQLDGIGKGGWELGKYGTLFDKISELQAKRIGG